MKKIPLSQGKFALIDDEDFELASKYKWHYRKSGRTNGKNGYAEHTIGVKGTYNKKTRQYEKRINIFMHNFIIKPPKKMCIDHINRNGLDNRKSNLRIVTIAQNYHNFPKKGKNKYRGATFLKGRSKTAMKWECSMTVKGKSVYVGVYKTEKQAAMAYDEKIKELYGESALLNFPNT